MDGYYREPESGSSYNFSPTDSGYCYPRAGRYHHLTDWGGKLHYGTAGREMARVRSKDLHLLPREVYGRDYSLQQPVDARIKTDRASRYGN